MAVNHWLQAWRQVYSVSLFQPWVWLLVLNISVSLGCARVQVRTAFTKAAVDSSEVFGPEVFGQWSWTHRSAKGTLNRIENETWTLYPDPNDNHLVRGFYLRRVRFQSKNNTPFACNQHTEFTIVTGIELFGSRTRNGAVVREVKRTREPNLCASSKTIVSSKTAWSRVYTLSPTELTLVATSGNIRQQLSPSIQRLQQEPSATILEGSWQSWQWQGWHRESDLMIKSRELWMLKRTGDRIDGSYRRSVKLSTLNGEPLDCDPGTNRSQWEQVFEISGSLGGPTREDIRLTEVRASWVPAPPVPTTPGMGSRGSQRRSQQPRCARGETTHLDSAQGRLVSNQLELHWRSGRRQVLRLNPRLTRHPLR